MTESLPARATRAGRAGLAPSGSRREAVQDAAGRMVLHALPRMPDRLKRLMLGGRTVTIDGNTLDTALQLALAAQRLGGGGGLIRSENVAVARRRMEIQSQSFPQVHVGITSTDVSLPGPAGALRARHYQSNVDGAPLLVFYPGGGFVIGGIKTHGNLAELICQEAGVDVLFVEYRLAPEHKAPAAVDDAWAAYRWACEHAAELGADPDRVAVGGDSAGGNLAAVVSQRARDQGVPPPALQLLLYPITNYCGDTRSRGLFADGFFLRRRDMDFCDNQYIGGSGIDPADPRVSPLLADNLACLPPAIVITAGFDPLRDEGRQYAEALRAAGNEVDAREYGTLIHAFANMFAVGGGAATATAEIISALRTHLRRS